MARTYYVKAFRGQRKCQYKPNEGWNSQCGLPKSEHESGAHPFTQKPLTCNSCGKPINIGDPYKWVAPRAHRAAAGRRMNRHTTCPAWKPSELTSSQTMGGIYAAQEEAEAALTAAVTPGSEDTEEFLEELRSIAEQMSEAIREVAEQCQESAQNIVDGFGHETYQSEELESKGDELEQWADDIGQVQFEDFGVDDDEDPNDSQEQLEQWADDQRDLINNEICACPL